jgi:hypothetical protein
MTERCLFKKISILISAEGSTAGRGLSRMRLPLSLLRTSLSGSWDLRGLSSIAKLRGRAGARTTA